MSIVTPSYNQAQFIEETIRSVLLQGYPDLEYVIIDGGSTDGSVEIIRKYEPWLAYWVSEKDNGQSDALNKGFARTSGEIVAWLNSDDVYLQQAISRAAIALKEQPDVSLVHGSCDFTDEQGNHESYYGSARTVRELIVEGNSIPQPSTFMRRTCLEQVGGIAVQLRYVMDYDLWVRMARCGRLYHIPEVLSKFRQHDSSKTVSQSVLQLKEWEGILASEPQVRLAVSETDLVEAQRRTQMHIALQSFLTGNETEAISYLEKALSGETWPFGSLDRLVDFVLTYQWSTGPTMTEASLDDFVKLLVTVRPRKRSRRLRSRLIAVPNMRAVFEYGHEGDRATVRRHLAVGLWHDPRWLRNRGVLSIGAEVLLGARITGWFRGHLKQLSPGG